MGFTLVASTCQREVDSVLDRVEHLGYQPRVEFFLASVAPEQPIRDPGSLQFAQVQETNLVEEGIFVRIPSCRMTSISQTSATRSCSSRCHMDYSTTYEMKTNVRLPRSSGNQSD